MGYQGKHAGYIWIVSAYEPSGPSVPELIPDYKHVSAYATLHSNPNLKTGTRKLKIPDEALSRLPVKIKVLYRNANTDTSLTHELE